MQVKLNFDTEHTLHSYTLSSPPTPSVPPLFLLSIPFSCPPLLFLFLPCPSSPSLYSISLPPISFPLLSFTLPSILSLSSGPFSFPEMGGVRVVWASCLFCSNWEGRCLRLLVFITFVRVHQVAARGAKFDVCDCLLLLCYWWWWRCRGGGMSYDLKLFHSFLKTGRVWTLYTICFIIFAFHYTVLFHFVTWCCC